MPLVSAEPSPPRKPRPWDPDATRTGSLLLVVGLVVSVGLHSGIPVAGSLWRVKSITQLPVTMEFESMPLPPAEELADGADDVDEPADEPVDEPADAPEPTPTPAKPETPTEPEPEPDTPEPVEPEPVEPEPVAAEGPTDAAPPTSDAELAQRIAERDAKRAAWMAERQKRIAERNARRQAAREKAAREAKQKGGAPEAGNTEGNPELVYLCTATDKGQSYQPRTERPISSWMSIVPTVFAHFETRPNLADYLGRMNQVYVPKKRLGIIDFAAPAEVMQLTLEQPAGTKIAVGRLDARCLIGLRYRPKLFPIELKRLPARIINSKNASVAALINVTIYKDASIDIAPFDASQPALPFSSGRLKNAKQIERNIEDHFQAVRLANAFAELFGVKKPAPPKAPKGGRSSKSKSATR
jgi:outer membrane biosynthesis protein TonB